MADASPAAHLGQFRRQSCDWASTYAPKTYTAGTDGAFCAPTDRNGDPGMIRTCDKRFRKPLLYPSELRGHDWIWRLGITASSSDILHQGEFRLCS